MNIQVMVKTNSPNPRIEEFGDRRYLVYVSSEPDHNKANIELISMLSKYFSVPYQKIHIKTGLTDKNKLIEIGN